MSKSELTAPALQLKNIHRSFVQAGQPLHVLQDVNLSLMPGEMVALVGPSGSGKSTLLHTAGLLEKAQSGEIIIEGKNCESASEAERTFVRLHSLGFVYQFHHLLPEFTAEENVMLPQMIAGVGKDQAAKRAHTLLEKVGLSHRLKHLPSELSGGEQQRVAIVRALANDPDVLLADEPTGNLDEQTATEVFAVLKDLIRHEKIAALIATHNNELAAQMDSTVSLHEGRLMEAA